MTGSHFEMQGIMSKKAEGHITFFFCHLCGWILTANLQNHGPALFKLTQSSAMTDFFVFVLIRNENVCPGLFT